MYLIKTLDEKRIKLLDELKNAEFLKGFAMGGGTALSLQLGLRYSVDFDFFTKEHFSVDDLLYELKSKFKDRISLQNVNGSHSSLEVAIDGVNVSFFEYEYPVIRPLVDLAEIEQIKLLSPEDIACMKFIAIIQRGTKKDFFDLYFILKKSSYTVKDLLMLIDEKYGDNNLKTLFLEAMVYFDDADRDELQKVYVDYSWEEIKKYYIKLFDQFCKILSGE